MLVSEYTEEVKEKYLISKRNYLFVYQPEHKAKEIYIKDKTIEAAKT